MSLPRSRSYALAIAAALVAAGCVSPGDPGVRTEAVQADIVFGVSLPEEEEISAAAPPPQAEAGSPVTQQLRVPFRNRIPSRFENVAFTVSPEQVAADCPPAPLGAAPEEIAARVVEEPPVPGLYRFKLSGTRTLTINGSEIPSTISGFQPRVVQNVETVSETSWRFEVVEPLGEGSRVTSWIVNTEPTEVSQKPPYIGENPTRVGEPARGIAMESITDYDGDGNPAGSFDGIPELLYMPLPVLSGESFQAIAVDTRGQTFVNEGETLDQKTVDACGTLVDGWFVRIRHTKGQSLETTVTDEEFIFSTPMGGLPISHRIVGQAVDSATGAIDSYDITYSLAQTEPDEVPGTDG